MSTLRSNLKGVLAKIQTRNSDLNDNYEVLALSEKINYSDNIISIIGEKDNIQYILIKKSRTDYIPQLLDDIKLEVKPIQNSDNFYPVFYYQKDAFKIRLGDLTDYLNFTVLYNAEDFYSYSLIETILNYKFNLDIKISNSNVLCVIRNKDTFYSITHRGGIKLTIGDTIDTDFYIFNSSWIEECPEYEDEQKITKFIIDKYSIKDKIVITEENVLFIAYKASLYFG